MAKQPMLSTGWKDWAKKWMSGGPHLQHTSPCTDFIRASTLKEVVSRFMAQGVGRKYLADNIEAAQINPVGCDVVSVHGKLAARVNAVADANTVLGLVEYKGRPYDRPKEPEKEHVLNLCIYHSKETRPHAYNRAPYIQTLRPSSEKVADKYLVTNVALDCREGPGLSRWIHSRHDGKENCILVPMVYSRDIPAKSEEDVSFVVAIVSKRRIEVGEALFIASTPYYAFGDDAKHIPTEPKLSDELVQIVPVDLRVPSMSASSSSSSSSSLAAMLVKDQEKQSSVLGDLVTFIGLSREVHSNNKKLKEEAAKKDAENQKLKQDLVQKDQEIKTLADSVVEMGKARATLQGELEKQRDATATLYTTSEKTISQQDKAIKTLSTAEVSLRSQLELSRKDNIHLKRRLGVAEEEARLSKRVKLDLQEAIEALTS